MSIPHTGAAPTPPPPLPIGPTETTHHALDTDRSASLPVDDTQLHQMFMNADAFSTPISVPNLRSSSSSAANDDARMIGDHKACQTSRVSVASKEVQIEDSHGSSERLRLHSKLFLLLVNKYYSYYCMQPP